MDAISLTSARPISGTDFSPRTMGLRLASILSSMQRYVRSLAVTLQTGTMALPVGVPRPVVKMMTWQPAAAIEVTDEMS